MVLQHTRGLDWRCCCCCCLWWRRRRGRRRFTGGGCDREWVSVTRRVWRRRRRVFPEEKNKKKLWNLQGSVPLALWEATARWIRQQRVVAWGPFLPRWRLSGKKEEEAEQRGRRRWASSSSSFAFVANRIALWKWCAFPREKIKKQKRLPKNWVIPPAPLKRVWLCEGSSHLPPSLSRISRPSLAVPPPSPLPPSAPQEAELRRRNKKDPPIFQVGWVGG